MTKDEAMKLALNFLEDGMPADMWGMDENGYQNAIAALRQALEQPSDSVSDREEQEFLLRNYVVCDRCNQVINKEFERLQQEQFFYGQDPNVLPAPDKGEINDK